MSDLLNALRAVLSVTTDAEYRKSPAQAIVREARALLEQYDKEPDLTVTEYTTWEDQDTNESFIDTQLALHNDRFRAHYRICEEPECIDCSLVICPTGEPLHFHRDGCPACLQARR